VTDRDLASARTFVEHLGEAAKTMQARETDASEQQAARDVARHAVPLQAAVERWMLLRATRAALEQ